MTPLAILAVALVGQLFCSALLLYDAHRRQLSRWVVYWCGSLTPVVGYIFFPIYLSRRSELPQYETPEMTVTQPSSGLAWAIRLPDPMGLPRRLAYTSVGLWTRYWRYVVVLAPIGLFALALGVDLRVLDAALSWVAAQWLLLWSLAVYYRDAVVSIDRDEGTVTHEYVSGVILEGDDAEMTVELSEIVCVKALPVGRHAIFRFRYDTWSKAAPHAVPVEQSHLPEALDAFECAGVDTRTVPREYAVLRVFGTVFALGVLPCLVVLGTGELGGDLLVILFFAFFVWAMVQAISGIRSVFATMVGSE